MQKFCHHCGTKTVIGAKFCSSCGTNLASLANVPEPQVAAQPVRPTQAARRPVQNFTPVLATGSGDDDDDSDAYLDQLVTAPINQNALQVDIIKDQPLGESVGALITQSMHGVAPENLSRPPQYTSSQQYMAEFKKEAGTLKDA